MREIGSEPRPIPVAGPSITQTEIDLVADAVAHAWYEDANVYHERFEKAFAEYLGTRFALTLPSCTSAIHLSLLALGIGPGDEVIVPEITWIATAAPIRYVGATPVFADIDAESWCLSAESFERCITPRTKAVIPVDVYGSTPDFSRIAASAERHRIAVIEDAAEAIGSEYAGKKAGSFGDTGVFSFHGSKTLTTGEGGMLVTDSADLFERALYLRDHCRSREGKTFWNLEVGYKYRMSSMQAALGLAQLQRIEELIDKKRRIFSWYREELQSMPGVLLNSEPGGTKNSYWMVTAILDRNAGLTKEECIARMQCHGIHCRPFFYPLSSLPAFSKSEAAQIAARENPVSYSLSPYGINLPSALNLTRAEVGRVAATLKRILAEEESGR